MDNENAEEKIKRLEKKVKELQREQVVMCIWCGETVLDSFDPTQIGKIEEHDRDCPENPLNKKIKELEDTINKATRADYEIEQLLGKALGYPAYRDDPKNFPNVKSDDDSVCVGEHTPVTLAMEAQGKIATLEAVLYNLYGNTLRVLQNELPEDHVVFKLLSDTFGKAQEFLKNGKTEEIRSLFFYLIDQCREATEHCEQFECPIKDAGYCKGN